MIKERLKSLQEQLIKENIDLYYLNTSDYHMSEYVPEYFKTIAYFSGFTGSLATLLVAQNDAFIFVDGRYHTQADKQCLENGVKVVKLGTKGALEPIEFIKKYYKNATIGLDGKRTSIGFAKGLVKERIKIKSIDVYSKLIENRAPLKSDEIYELGIEYTGLARNRKIELIKHCLKGRCHVVNNLESIAYLLNLRSSDILYTPVFLSYLVFLDNNVYLFVDSTRFNNETLNNLITDRIIVKPYDYYYDFLKQISNKVILLDENKVNYESFIALNARDNKIYSARSFIEDMKSIKNNVEQENTKKAHIYDGVAMLRFLMWLDSVDKSKLNEYEVAQVLDSYRTNYKAFDLSFGSIVAYNENSAIIHYAPVQGKSKQLDNNGILLLDTGGQYLEGTTDITRTVALGPVSGEVKKWFTIVLKSMFNLSEFKFIRGISGSQIDAIARQDIWAQGVDYRHGTGHGVGQTLSVHENPANIRYMHTGNGSENVEIKPGMIFSDEPGVYFEGKFGIRCENLVLCKTMYENEFGEFLRLETLTLVPFDTRLIDKNYLDEKTIKALNSYHQRVYETLLPYLNNEEAAYLRKMTKAI